jgi:hypothetical protein
MKTRFYLCLLMFVWAASLALPLAAEEGFTPLFDGKTLEGWTQRGGKAKYTVEEGAIVGTTVPKTPNSFLCTKKDYGDFILELDFKIDPGLNSGVQIRSESKPDYKNGVVHGYQVEIGDYTADRNWTGGIYDESRRGWLVKLDQEKDKPVLKAFKANDWNHLRVEAKGDLIRTWVNGVPAAELKDDKTLKGFIALQVHGIHDKKEPLKIRWKNIRVKELKASSPKGKETAIVFDALLDEMLDRDALARFPEPAYVCRQSSSYDRRSLAADDAQGWFANFDCCEFVREEKHGDRTEYVMHDAAGPGSIERFWVTPLAPLGSIRIYIDDKEKPVIEERAETLLGGKGPVGEPLSELCQKGYNLYLPIPYAKRCVITHDNPNLYYQINYRTYPATAKVESFTAQTLAASKEKIERVQKALAESEQRTIGNVIDTTSGSMKPTESRKIKISGPAAVRQLKIKLEAADLPAALRGTIVIMHFDGEATAWCPVGDFFGSGVGANAYRDWQRTVEKNGEMTCRWVMPFAKKAEIELKNVGSQDATAYLRAEYSPWNWDERSMHFHANWRLQSPVDSSALQDWNYLEAEGKGVYVGDMLAIHNPISGWWGEGDEKIFVDGEKFPSHFGTGTEDYYGYAFCTPKFFSSPFHAQPRADGPQNFGHVTNTRIRQLDGIPFQKSFRMDMEAWHCYPGVPMTYAAATYWYAIPGARSNRTAMPEVAKVITQPTPPPNKVADAIEGEDLKAAEKPRGALKVARNPLRPASGGAMLTWSGAKPGDVLTLNLPVTKDGTYAVSACLFLDENSIYQLYLDGKPVGEKIYAYRINRAINMETPLGTHELSAGVHKLAVKYFDTEPREVMQGYLRFSLDYLKLEPQSK